MDRAEALSCFIEGGKSMVEGSKVKLKMKKVILNGMKLDRHEYTCKVDSYEAQEEKLYFIATDDVIHKIRLDAKYQCHIYTNDGILACDGRIKERFQSEEGNVILFYIENGFYELLSE